MGSATEGEVSSSEVKGGWRVESGGWRNIRAHRWQPCTKGIIKSTNFSMKGTKACLLRTWFPWEVRCMVRHLGVATRICLGVLWSLTSCLRSLL